MDEEFNKQFPGLKGFGTQKNLCSSETYISEKDIKEHCSDKGIVKKVMTEIRDTDLRFNPTSLEEAKDQTDIMMRKLAKAFEKGFKELGL